MTIQQLKVYFRTLIKVVAGGPAVGTVGSNRAAGVLAALDAVADFVADLFGPTSDVYPSDAKQAQVVGLFTSGTQTTAADALLAGDPRSDYFYAEFYDFVHGTWYKCLPNPTAPDGQGNATAWWVRR